MTAPSFEKQINRNLLDIARSCRSLVGRSKSMYELAETMSTTGPLTRKSQSVVKLLEETLTTLSVLVDDSAMLKIDRQSDDEGQEKIVLRCVSNLVENADFGEEGEVETEEIEPAFRGRTACVGIPNLLVFLASLGRTGMLQVTTLDEKFTLVLEEGKVRYAVSDNCPVGGRLGDILVEQNAISRSELHEFLQQSGKRMLGEALVADGLVTEEQLRMALVYQVQQLFNRLFAVADASFCFYEDVTNPAVHGVQVSVDYMLLQGGPQYAPDDDPDGDDWPRAA